ncbi:hypothetical protein A2697_02605 [Candidatus Curtissbacteria bacterium RIFCSPHIGHO2_01_FULL_41_44]|uniref:Uncharacterized protein n=1 Tax=Candidatus Curtissbacteria bacterium RIFCSPLOWO2_01_FULL_42_50 TaxID=1797730 RepID=A0A1F5H2B3_9BACT|nr:MAG: hypothetical protein A2697_02605 [Candidatus Curtissbacteria bacterium RIFCSPHIGHO2_01_FULL_41_44]OGD92868.1 MAG: hypothetical protein A3C33_02120 [Candidatus Curtissbacteria bacterium RIFCSPHIGHO2_02_FULL_42_58]OGD96585.1 MAG: hypothetical protein A3E71_02770 [Candidatus Curtissbacteria bacterium RIFCSPHIGHO2_12_FULL_42_33]OGD98286.1 MAG: hypothetical protein A3B54_04210 [Candidatus Curtissbacteria bacterium RIFCSPLOWO2_01_FULL_42_50]OGE10358.1 MAG: hypothetical protein A3H87_02130 [Ca
MKIIVQTSQPKIDKYIKLLFEHLQKDNYFEKLILNARKNLRLNIPTAQPNDSLEVIIRPERILRSESIKIPISSPDAFIETPFVLKLNEELDKVLKEYKFLQDWRKGLGSFVVNDSFVISDESSSIKLRVRNKRYLITGKLRDSFSEDGVKIVLTSKVSRKELREWINDNWQSINNLLDDLPSLASKSSRRPNYERDRLVTYLRKKKMTWSQIGIALNKIEGRNYDYKTNQDKLQQAYKDFPLK